MRGDLDLPGAGELDDAFHGGLPGVWVRLAAGGGSDH
ncbi:hypothetical protein SFR_4995 [Streptomyces sp. FR-008]|nr:hypothetical protein SFR_4995 [Streptomyces sp. FR-008]